MAHGRHMVGGRKDVWMVSEGGERDGLGTIFGEQRDEGIVALLPPRLVCSGFKGAEEE